MLPPYAGPTVFHLGPITLPLFGLLVTTGVFVGHAVAMRFGREKGIDVEGLRDAAAWAVGAGFLGAHVFDVVLSHPEKFSRDGILTLVKIWDGISSYGGFFGALAGLAYYFWRQGRSWWAEADALVVGLVFGWLFGRLGCTLTSDHVGHLSTFPLAFAYPHGARHNLGFYELAYTALVIVPAVAWQRGRDRGHGYRAGTYIALVCALYAPVRFGLDFLRATDIEVPDPRWLGLTAAQYSSVLLFALAAWMFARLSRRAAA